MATLVFDNKDLDPWQKEVLEEKGNICLRSGRQVGKSEVTSRKAAQYAIKNKNKTVMVIASVERQAFLLFEKILAYMEQFYPTYIKKGKDKPTKQKMRLRNGSVIICVPTGLSGHGIRGHTVDLLIADEAAFIPEAVWTAVTPMLAVTKGTIILLSTPHGKGGFYYDCYMRKDFKTWHVSSEDCPRKDDEFLAREKERMTEVQYAQEYLGEFIDELTQFFTDALIMKCMKGKRRNGTRKSLGVDVARLGTDETAIEGINEFGGHYTHDFHEIMTRKRTTEVSDRIINIDIGRKNKRIYIDDGGVGGGVFDECLVAPQTKRKVVAINNASRSITKDKTRKKKLLKEDLYNNIKLLMERGKLTLIENDEVFKSLKSVQWEYTNLGNIKIYGKYTHIAEGLIRAAWIHQDKSLNIWVSWS